MSSLNSSSSGLYEFQDTNEALTFVIREMITIHKELNKVKATSLSITKIYQKEILSNYLIDDLVSIVGEFLM